ncbi:hypothetical protein GOP47_0029383 [Adiantum capillus-veneris]|nr:hypothetical protein GOP47_0029383 [Adiantum capillus-veneris]
MDSFDDDLIGTGTEMGKMWKLNQTLDHSLDVEAAQVHGLRASRVTSSLAILSLAFQSLGVVYGDLGTSPLYVFHSTFSDGIPDERSLMGVLSCIIYSLTLIPLIKYTFFVMRANDNGEGGTFALYSLICRNAKIHAITNQHPTDQKLTTYSRERFDKDSVAGKTRRWLEAKEYRQSALVLLVLFGTCMVIGDGILTPAISVLSSVSGIKVSSPEISNDVVVGVACVILVGLFFLQRFGTDKVGWVFAPLVLTWFLSIGSIGIYNIIKHNPAVFRAFSPLYIVQYFVHDTKAAWVSLGGIVLSITGTEALYADISHFSASPVQIAFTFLVFPCLLAAYLGQAAYLTKFPDHVNQAFYKSIPKSVYWPMFVVATISAVVASQATISATFSIIKQAQALGCFPRVKIVHTSNKMFGQVYIPEINWILMVLCVVITAGFRKTTQIGNAYGIAVVAVMLVTTILMTLIMLLVWRRSIILVVTFASVFLLIELVYLSSVLFKVDQGGWAPLVIAVVFLIVMYVWHYGTLKRYEFEMQSKVSMGWILGLGPSLGLVRVPGIGFVYTELAHGIPPIFSHFVTHLPALHSVVIFVCIKYLPVNTVPTEERFLIRRIGPKDFFLYRCVVRYGYKDLHKKDDKFEQNLVKHLIEYVRQNFSPEPASESTEGDYIKASYPCTISSSDPACSGFSASHAGDNDHADVQYTETFTSESILSEASMELPRAKQVTFALGEDADSEDELEVLSRASEEGIVHILGDVIVRANRESNFLKRIAVNHVYAFLRRICRENSAILNIPHESLFSIGQVYLV